MRFLHTSDWHLGRRFHSEDLIPAQRDFLDHLVDTARTDNVDAVLVAGDIYDRAIPSLDAVRLFSHALHQLADLNVPIIMISGNHDSAHRLGVASSLLARTGIHLRTDPATCHTPVLLKDGDGPVAIYGIPYLEPSMVRTSLEAEAVSHRAVLTAALDRIRADLADNQLAGTRSVVLAHAFVTPGTGRPEERDKTKESTSERDITVGGVAHVGADIFHGIDYVALGHLHGTQRVSDRIHYSGSPLAYSFSEAHHTKSITLVDLAPGAVPTLTHRPCPVPRRLERVTGFIEDLLTNPAYEPLTDAWLEVTLTDTALPFEAMARLRRRFPHTAELKHRPAHIPAQATNTTYSERIRGRSDLDITSDFIHNMRGTEPTPDEHALLQQAVEASRLNEQQKETV
ncbi:exonuclease SbcCD subunit D [Streptomyces sp. ms191]|uniref:exonuclease SbcCD subunit D n=1 Tax=Streptomyces sp. ms191 TaxID=1827978 RepID=UPI0011CD93D0|nr:exonuclease SbcCD subunit D [Streptomyces sp. ms191]TXS34488.1 exonuclease SbcCD subunit D [Streptomyces sp. ms191]